MDFSQHGVWTALVTPFRRDGSVDTEALARLVEFEIAGGVTGLVPCGTTGESPTLSYEEHEKFVRSTIAAADGRAKVMAGAGSNDTSTAIRHVLHSQGAGADAALIVDCYYNGPSSLELRHHYYERLLDQAPDLPLVPYVIPGRTGCALSAEDLAVLHQTHPERIPAVKEATGDLARMRRDRELAGPSLAIFSGDDDMTLPMMSDPEIRAAGVISVMSNLIPGAITRMVRAQREGDGETAGKIAHAAGPLFRMVGCTATSRRTLPDGRVIDVADKFRNPTPIKTMMRGLGMTAGPPRPPLGGMTAPGVALVREALRAVHAGDPSLLAPIEEAFDVDVAQRLADDDVWSALVEA